MSRKVAILLAVAGALIIGLMVWGYYATTELVTETLDIGYHGKARQNSFLAVQRFAEKGGYSVSSRAVIPYDDLYDFDTVLAPVESLPDEQQKLNYLKEWIDSGGTLITGFVSSPSADEQIVLSNSVKRFIAVADLSADGQNLNDEAFYGDDPYRLEGEAYINVDRHRYKYYSNDDEDNFIWGQKDIGDGRIMLFRSLNIFENESIGKAQNIDLLNEFFDYYIDEMLIVYRAYSPSIFTWIWKNARLSLYLLILYIVLWILCISKRFGPVLASGFLGSRKIMEHIEVMGQYLWTGKHSAVLIKSMQKRILDRVKKSNPSWLSLEKEKLYEELSRQSKLSHEGVAHAMEVKSLTDQEAFHTVIKTLKNIKDSL